MPASPAPCGDRSCTTAEPCRPQGVPSASSGPSTCGSGTTPGEAGPGWTPRSAGTATCRWSSSSPGGPCGATWRRPPAIPDAAPRSEARALDLLGGRLVAGAVTVDHELLRQLAGAVEPGQGEQG